MSRLVRRLPPYDPGPVAGDGIVYDRGAGRQTDGYVPVRAPIVTTRSYLLLKRERYTDWIPVSIPDWQRFFLSGIRPVQISSGTTPQEILDLLYDSGGDLKLLPDNPVGTVVNQNYPIPVQSISAWFDVGERGNDGQGGEYIIYEYRALSYYALRIMDDIVKVNI